jgi:SAM-dependent methyltransferase
MRRVHQWFTNLRLFKLPRFRKAALPPFTAISPKVRVSSVRGYVDLIDIDGVAGWVLNEHIALDDLAVHISIGTEYLGNARANIEAPDQIALGLPINARRFRFRFPHRIPYADLPRVEVAESATNQLLDGGLEYFRSYLAKKYMISELGGPYCLFFEASAKADPLAKHYHVTVAGDIRVSSERASHVQPCADDETRARLTLGLPTMGRIEGLWFYSPNTNLGFRYEATIAEPSDDLIVVNLSYESEGSTLRMPLTAIPVGDLATECAASIPEPDMIKRVIGHYWDAWTSYVVGGWTNVVHLDWMCKKYLVCSLAELETILDWGCGCARNTQPLIKIAPGSRIHGIDIDPVNIAWSKQHVVGATFDVSGLFPPLDFADDTFDIVYGLSVFTHLTEPAQDLWLAELHRVLKPGGIAFLSYHGEAAAYSREFSVDTIENYRQRGIEDDVFDGALAGVIEKRDYYRSTFHTTDYLYDRWSKYFDIAGIEPTPCSHQWFAVCQKAL